MRQRATEVFKNGKRVPGEYDAMANEVRLYAGSNMQTLSHELIHFSQAQRLGVIGADFRSSLVPMLERNVRIVLKEWGYVMRGRP